MVKGGVPPRIEARWGYRSVNVKWHKCWVYGVGTFTSVSVRVVLWCMLAPNTKTPVL